ncbi:MAG: GspH/FimT family pseudopilin [Burkholderiales bacterium]|jgi:type IV fimbrial biogenesis protein FimT|nr:GspH/FimT family pseudopilin [Burkholderiales bacterium]
MNIERQPGWLHRPPLRGAASPRPCAQRGVTLVELMVVLGIAAIILAFAVPNFREFVARNRLDGAAQELLATLQFARSEATRRGEQVTIRLAGTAGSKNWGSGWAMFVDTDRDGVLDTGEEVIRQGMAMNAPLTLIGSSNLDTFIAFNRDGRLTNAGGGYFVLCQGGALTEDGQARARAVLVNGAGRVRMAARNSSSVPVTDTGAVTSCTNP